MKLKEEAIDYRDGDVELSGLVIWDGNDLARPGLVVVYGGAGLDEHAKGRARQSAELGHLVFACDMYGKGVMGDRERVLACMQELVADRDKIARRAQAGVEVLTSHPLLDGNIAAVGYCFGGRAVIELARTGADLAGAISLHGSVQTANPASPGGVKTKVLVCHGALDPHVPTAQVTGFIEEMNAGGGRLPADRLRRRDAWLHPRRRSAGARSRKSRRLRSALVPGHQGIPWRNLGHELIG
jgi:dienelactone hydrolase